MRELLAGPGFFRLALALIVFADHATRLSLGLSAVLLFFMLSGYWIQKMWTGRYAHTRQTYLTYLVSRFWRLLPAFLVCSALAWCLLAWKEQIPSDIKPISQAFSNLFILGYDSLPFQADGPAWSLDIEVQFYLIAPVLIWAITRSVAALPFCALASAGAYLLDIKGCVIPYLVYFAIGATAGQAEWRPSRSLALASLAFSLSALALTMAGPWHSLVLVGNHSGPLAPYNDTANAVLALAMAPWAMFTTRQKGGRQDGLFGDLSYGVYLLHLPILVALAAGGGTNAERIVKLGAAILLVATGSLALHFLVDRPNHRLRASWVARRMTTPKAEAPPLSLTAAPVSD